MHIATYGTSSAQQLLLKRIVAFYMLKHFNEGLRVTGGKMSKKIKVAYCLAGLDGGVGTVILNYLDHMPLENYQIDIISQGANIEDYRRRFEQRGCRVMLVPSKSESLYKNLSSLKNIMSDSKYDIVHAHMTSTNGFPLMVAKSVGVKIRISHSHLAGKKNMKSEILSTFAKAMATNFVACGNDAGRFLYGRSKYVVFNNAIDFSTYAYDEIKRNNIRTQLSIAPDEVVIGNVGRFVEQKNHKFIIDFFVQYKSSHPKSKLLLVGDGPLRNDIEEIVSNDGLSNSVIFTGNVRNVQDYYQAMDCFFLPSLIEGLCIAAIEAQSNGLACVFSDRVSRETAVDNDNQFISLESDMIKWANAIDQALNLGRRNEFESLRVKGFDIALEGRKLDEYYKKLLAKDK